MPAATPVEDVDLPYFDRILEHLQRGPDSALARAFERHVHWGYYAQPQSADDSVEGYIAAAEALTERICEAAGAGDQQAILDVGCGFGGTLHTLNERVRDCELTGLNIDPRQLVRARELVQARAGNTVAFVQGDACALPFKDSQFDVLLAVESAFHFRSRKQFLREVQRVLKPGGRLVLSDFILNSQRLGELVAWLASIDAPSAFYGSNSIPPTSARYARSGQAAGLKLTCDEDITAHTLPTYPAMRRLYDEAEMPDGVASTHYLEQLALRGFVQYRILSFTSR